MATSAKRPLVGRLGGSVSTRVLGLTDRPVLLVGPMVSPRLRITRPTLVIGVGPIGTCRRRRVDDCFLDADVPGRRPVGRRGRPDRRRASRLGRHGRGGARQVVRRAARRRRSAGVLAGASRRRTGLWVEDFAGQIADAVLVATSARWTDAQRHWHSETRELVRHSAHPVLVVPAAGGALPPESPAAVSSDVSSAQKNRLPSRSFRLRSAGSSREPVASVGWPSTWRVGRAFPDQLRGR